MMQIDDGDDEAARAYAAISQQLQSWTSPNLAASSSVDYSQDSVQWMKSFANDGTSLTPQKRSSGAATPIMSNSGKKQSLSPLDDDLSPWIDRSLSTRSTTETHEYRRYHDILYTYLAARRSLSERLRLTEQEAALVAKNVAALDVSLLAQEERRIELEYLSSLAALEDVLEGNVWSLLATLRSLGIDALLWQEKDGISTFLRKLASRTDETPGKLVNDLYHSPISPLILQRRKQILTWMEQCHEESLVGMDLPRKLDSMWPASLERLQRGANDPTKVTSLDPDAPLLVADSASPLYGKDGEHEEVLMKACLAYTRSGRMDEAMTACQRQGQPWKCAAWSGGEPYDVQLIPDPESQQVVAIQVGNRRRALWKRTCWALARSPRLTDAEAAIYAILSNDVQTALKNPALRSWEGGMYACWSAMLGRLEDDVLHRHNISKKIPQEEEQLQATASIASWNEASILNILLTSPFEEMRPTDALRGAMASFLVGKNAVVAYVLRAGAELDSHDLEHLRFLAHLLLYLDSLSAGTTATTLSGVAIVKNRVVLQYLQQLGLRPDLWHMLALYASLLPTESMIQEYSPILCNVQADDERASMCKQMQELLPSGMDLVVLRRVVRLLLKEQDPHGSMRSIKWLCHSDEHLGDALVCTNMLLRNFLLARDDQVSRALLFIDQHLPKRVLEFVKSSSSQDEEMNDASTLNLIRDSKLEFGALQCYLEAYRAFMNWKEVMKDTPPTTVTSKIVQNRAALNRIELDIANSAERRELVQQKRMTSRKIVEAADAARSKLLQVLTYPGGWLLEEDSIRQGNNDEARQRCRELVDLQARYLPRAVFFFHNVCSETATWMADSLDDAVPVLGKKALFTLDSASELASSPLSPHYWIQHAMSLAETVAAEENGICDTFSEDDTKHFCALMAESEVLDLQYKAN
jgi:nuclear pore complex protein Nup107